MSTFQLFNLELKAGIAISVAMVLLILYLMLRDAARRLQFLQVFMLSPGDAGPECIWRGLNNLCQETVNREVRDELVLKAMRLVWQFRPDLAPAVLRWANAHRMLYLIPREHQPGYD